MITESKTSDIDQNKTKQNPNQKLTVKYNGSSIKELQQTFTNNFTANGQNYCVPTTENILSFKDTKG